MITLTKLFLTSDLIVLSHFLPLKLLSSLTMFSKIGFSFLRRLSGRSHKVHTGVSVLLGERIESFSVVTEVYFGVLTEEVIDWYWSVGESFDKAGAYGIQGAGGLLIDKIVGSYSNVMGLPIRETIHCLEDFGFTFFLKKPDKNY